MKLNVNWMEGWGNDPRIEIILDEGETMPPIPDDCAYTKRDGLHRTTFGPFVHYFYTDGKPNNGYGGANFRGVLEDGTPFNYKGAWSSRAGVVNALFPEDPVVDVVVRSADPRTCGTAIAMRVEDLIELYYQPREHEADYDFGLAVVLSHNEIIVQPTRHGKVKNPDRTEILCPLLLDNYCQFMQEFYSEAGKL